MRRRFPQMQDIQDIQDIQDNIFIEQAEYLDSTSFEQLSADHPEENIILKKLSQGGAKLISGPRGCGKTTLMLKCYFNLCSKNASALPIYVNFKSSLKLEPLYRNRSDAMYWFNQWMLLKIYEGFIRTLEEIKFNITDEIVLNKNYIEKKLNKLEFGHIDNISDLEAAPLTIQSLEKNIMTVLEKTKRNRCILLLDDAAHAFSPEQQRDFFDFFRQVKSRIISPKAAIYPGVTSYSATFHVGHDAEEINAWIRPDSTHYLKFMKELLEKRLPNDVYANLSKNEDLLNIVCYSAFGVPRALLNMVRNFYSQKEENIYSINFRFRKINEEIKNSFENTYSLYKSLKYKLPIYENFVLAGDNIFNNIVDTIKEYNKNKLVNNQSVTIAIKKPINQELSKVIGFFQYSGLLMPKGEISRGEKGVFELYVIHYGSIVVRNVFFGATAINASEYSKAFQNRNQHEFTRISPSTLLKGQDPNIVFKLSLPPCQSCRTPRINEHAKFCVNCGSPLKTASTFETLVSSGIETLPLTPNRVKTIKNKSTIKTVKDILMDHDHKELRSVPQVGPIWAKRIYSYAEEFIA